MTRYPVPSDSHPSATPRSRDALRRRLSVALLVVPVLLLSACGGRSALEPVGIGSGRDDLKRSPCACYELRQNYAGWALS